VAARSNDVQATAAIGGSLTETQWFHVLVAGFLGGLAVGLWKIHNLLLEIRDLLDGQSDQDE
jgi:hypothetical protein